MKQVFSALLVVVVVLAATLGDAEARRLGGGRSLGAQRSIIAPSRNVQPPVPAQKAAPAAASPAGKFGMSR